MNIVHNLFNKRKILYLTIFAVSVIVTGFLFSFFLSPIQKSFYPNREKLPLKAPLPLPTPAPTINREEGVLPHQTFQSETSLLETTNRLMIYTATVSLKVKNVTTAINKITSLTEEFGGFIQEINIYGTERKEGYITVRIPQTNFQEFLKKIASIGKLENKKVEGQDVTEKFIDLQARLNNSKKEEQRLLQILEKAETVDEILKVEKEIKTVRTEIDTLTGQIKFLQRRITYSTIKISLEEPAPQPPWLQLPETDWSYPLELGLTILLDLIQAIITLTIALSPIAIPGFLIYKLYRRKKKS